MNRYLYLLAKKFLPLNVRRGLYYFIKGEKIRTITKILVASSKDLGLKLYIGYNGKKKGYVTVGFNAKSDIVIKKDKRLLVPDNTAEEIIVENFINELDDALAIRYFFNECFRVLKPHQQITIHFADADKIFKTKFENKEYFSQERFWNIKKRYLFSDQLDVVNAILFDELHTKKLLNTNNVKNFLSNANFEEIKIVEGENNNLYSTITACKRDERGLTTKLATRMPTSTQIMDDVPIYYYNCDPLWTLKNFETIATEKLQQRNFASVIGSLYFINLIPYLRPKKLYLFDINDYQTRYMRLCKEIIERSANFETFLENLFSRKYQKDIKGFLSSSPDTALLEKNRSQVADKEIFDLSIGKIANGTYALLEDTVPVLRISGNSMCQNITILDKELFKPGPEINVIYTKKGLADHFDYIKQVLQDCEIQTAGLDSNYVTTAVKDGGIIYVSNIGEDDWLNDFQFTNSDIEAIQKFTESTNISKSFKEQWINGYEGFNNFLTKIHSNFWIIDSNGGIFSTQTLLKHRSDSHEWLWQKIKPLIRGNTLEIIHKKEGEWGFHEHLATKNIYDYLEQTDKNSHPYDTLILHLLISNGIPMEDFIRTLSTASKQAKRIIVMEHERDSENFGQYATAESVDIRMLMSAIRSVPEINAADIHVTWSGTGLSTDEEKNGEKANFNRNTVVTIDL